MKRRPTLGIRKPKASRPNNLFQYTTPILPKHSCLPLESVRYVYHNVPIDFPFPAYACQEEIMDVVAKCLMAEEPRNALIESPTGTGKSLSLLCSILGWLQYRRESASEVKLEYENPTKIYFSSRTHSQLSQLIGEMGKTRYRPPMSVLSSRSNTCLLKSVRQSKNPDDQCRDKIRHDQCRYYKGVDRLVQAAGTIWDLEDLAENGKRVGGCPYFAARKLAQSADLVFLPYSYICNAKIRKAMGLGLDNNVIVFDEAHNLEDAVRDASSLEISQEMLEMVKNEAQLNNLETQNRFASQILDHYKTFKSHSEKHYSVKDRYCVWEGENLYMEMARIRKHLVAYKPDSALGEQLTDTLESLWNMIALLGDRTTEHYRSHVMTVSEKPHPRFGKIFVLNFWCLDGKLGFQDICKKARNIILCSGTLSPLDSFSSELGVMFHDQLETQHVIESSRIWIGSIPTGPGGRGLLGTYKNLEQFFFQDEIGASICSVASIVPHGVLVFFPSYSFLDKVVERMKQTGHYEKLKTHKVILIEPHGDEAKGLGDFVARYRSSLTKAKGAMIFAVYRGKISEGTDFSDNYARAVVAIGVPYPNLGNIQIDSKKRYNDEQSISKNVLNGNRWYEIQAFRALNQAIGRCVRHRNDWGAIILLDSRFSNSRTRTLLPRWTRDKFKMFGQFDKMAESLESFVSSMSSRDLPDSPDCPALDEELSEILAMVSEPLDCAAPNPPESSISESLNAFPQDPLPPAHLQSLTFDSLHCIKCDERIVSFPAKMSQQDLVFENARNPMLIRYYKASLSQYSETLLKHSIVHSQMDFPLLARDATWTLENVETFRREIHGIQALECISCRQTLDLVNIVASKHVKDDQIQLMARLLGSRNAQANGQTS